MVFHTIKYTTAETTTKNMTFIIFGFSDPENIDIDTNIKFLSSLFPEISDI